MAHRFRLVREFGRFSRSTGVGPAIGRSDRLCPASPDRSHPCGEVEMTAPVSSTPSPLLAWLALVRISLVRQARMRQMVWVALGLMALAVVFVGLNTYLGSWELTNRRSRP